MHLTPHHAKYFAHDLTRRAATGMDRLSMALFDAAVDLNPHQIEAALFALQSPLSKGVILADEVGLGKTIEAGIVLCQFWAERKRRLLVICPASLRKQWAMELTEKFNLPTRVLDAKAYREALRAGRAPLAESAVLILSFNYANALRDELKTAAWDLVVIDEAHKLRNAYRPSNKVGQGIRWATEDCRKLLLTATPLQNSLLELYGLSTLIDEHLFGDLNSFRSQFASAGSSIGDLRQRLSGFCKRTLRNQVTEYIRYTARRTITRPFRPSDDEHALYEAVSGFLQREDSYALPARQRHLTALVLRKLLASSSQAIAATLDTLRARLETLRDERVQDDAQLAEGLIAGEEFDDELLDEILAEPDEGESAKPVQTIDRKKLREEIEILERLASWARSIGTDTKTKALLAALRTGFENMATIGAERKALIFTESRRTQEHLKGFLESHGYAGQVVLFNGTNGGPEATAIYERWVERNRNTGRSSGSRAVDLRTALIEHFREEGSILLATEAAAEGINLQFCSLVINYDLPWNPQRIEQRIGRCHRYGQRHDVVVINFLNERNEADRRVLELLDEKFSLFEGVFGASDEVLGTIESGLDFEKRILAIYQECRTPDEIDAAFRALQAELDEQIRTRMDDTRRALFEHFDEDVHQRLRLRLDDARAQLDRFGRRFWSLSRFVLGDRARFHDDVLAFDLERPPNGEIAAGRYHLISKSHPKTTEGVAGEGGEERNQFLYRLSHPLGEYVVDTAKAVPTRAARIAFDVSHHPSRIHAVEALRGKRGFLTLSRLVVESYEREEYLLFSGFDDAGASLDQETMEKLFGCSGHVQGEDGIPVAAELRLTAEAERHAKATVSRSLEANSVHFNQARDYFAGSGSTAQSIVEIARVTGTRMRFILVEMADYFDTVLLPRIKKVTFTPEWKDGKPKRLATAEEAERSPRIVKVVRLESYEDTLNNLDPRTSSEQQLLLGAAEAQGADGLKEQYLLRYMLDVETRGSQSLLNVQAFSDPTAYKLKVKRPGSDESREVNVDLLETFNWLIGLTVKHIAAPQTFRAEFDRDGEKRLRIKGRLKQDAGGPYWFRTVTGTLPDGRRALVIWRKLVGEAEEHNLVLDAWFEKQGYSAKDSEFDLIYVNGGNNLENLKTPEDLWKVRLIDEDFQRLMFEPEGAQV
jgi:superfamily II DNA or RNA helicase